MDYAELKSLDCLLEGSKIWFLNDLLPYTGRVYWSCLVVGDSVLELYWRAPIRCFLALLRVLPPPASTRV